ncbi:MAG: PF20097 family protein [Anaerovoracaceae bacterium]
MLCKCCGSEMSKGYIQCRDGVYWDEKKRKLAAIPLSSTAIKISSDDGGAFSGSAVVAYRCEKCRRIEIEY